MRILKKIKKKIYWKIRKKKFKTVGKNFSVGNNFDVKNEKNICIGNNFLAGDNIKIRTWEIYNDAKTGYIPQIIIGNNVTLNDNCFISCLNEIEIGNDCLIGGNVFITDNFHGNNSYENILIKPLKRPLYSKGKVKIGERVLIGRNASIMPNVIIGNGTVIGANSVVTHSFGDNLIIAGVPAKIIKKIE